MPAEKPNAQTWVRESGGLPLGNFALCANVPPRTILKNPGWLGKWLQPLCRGQWTVRADGVTHAWEDLELLSPPAAWPLPVLRVRVPSSPPREVELTAFAPLGFDDADTSSLPVLCLEFRATAGPPLEIAFQIIERGDFEVQIMTEDGPADSVTLSAEQPVRRMVLLALDADDLAASRFDDPQALARRVFHDWTFLREATGALSRRLPDAFGLGDTLRAYMGAAVYLTRVTRRGEVLTMGYTDLNQRDSYWTSWAHLHLWPGLERRMIEASASAMKTDGKIPTCILSQKYEREDDLDINAYFVLRVLRYANTFSDREFMYRLWPHVVCALRWLMRRCEDGLPVQGSFWGDWKDVRGVEGRKFSPHACLLYLAALTRALVWGRRLNMPELDELEAARAAAEARLNRPVQEGGLWNGRCYVQVWHDGRGDDHVLQDQCVGLLFDVVPPDRAQAIVKALADNRTPFGVRETWPYFPAEFGYEPGCYHNGGIWPWLSFVDAWARDHAGHREEALAIVRDVARADLLAGGDGVPHEYLHADTGENRGFPLQGWNASLFGFLSHLDHQDIP
ncbi:MAG: hypothetical protein JJU05_01960 [Verrucomicrobia bacterium]|nr:hypothetical protein [Verrucomicrobiota bacterium]MCH8526174.1 hypothetical protein [Kiritimatiellia bacterium]